MVLNSTVKNNEFSVVFCGDKVAQLVRCQTSNQRVAGSIPGRALWSVLGQDSLFHIASVYPAAKWVP